jgi:LysM domain
MSGRQPRAVLAGLVAILTLATVTAGLPVALLRLGGSPIPRRLPSAHGLLTAAIQAGNGTIFVAAVRDVSWLAWMAFTVAVLAEGQALVRGRRAPRLHVAGLQSAAGRLVALACMTFASPAIAGLLASPALAASTRATVPPATSDLAAYRTGRTVVVQPGDCLWAIAERYLGSGDRYPEIVRLNLGHLHRPVADQAWLAPATAASGTPRRAPRGHCQPAPAPGASVRGSTIRAIARCSQFGSADRRGSGQCPCRPADGRRGERADRQPG